MQITQKKRLIQGEKDNDRSKKRILQVIEKPARKVIVKRGKKADNYFDYCNEVGCDVWAY